MKFFPFNKPWLPPAVIEQMKQAATGDMSSFDRDYLLLSRKLLSLFLDKRPTILTSSCTHALELAALLLNIKPGDEVIMSSFTFVSSANPFVLRGAIPVFVDIRPDTLNINEDLIEAAITSKTRVILAVHYAGVSCEMKRINDIANKNGLQVVEDAAHGLLASYDSRPLGTMSDLGCLSFDVSKNIHCYKGGALIINNEQWLQRALIISEKGTNRNDFNSGKTDNYTWTDIGSNYSMNFLNAVYLYYQLEYAEEITRHRMKLWNRYFTNLNQYASAYKFKLPNIPLYCKHNAHIFYLICSDQQTRDGLIRYLANNGITALFHFIPLHSSPAGIKYGRFHGADQYTTDISNCILRLPLFHELSTDDVDYICERVIDFFRTPSAVG